MYFSLCIISEYISFPLLNDEQCQTLAERGPMLRTAEMSPLYQIMPNGGNYYCRVSIKLTPLRDRDTPDEIFGSSPYLEDRDKRKNSSSVADF
jgi:hypothetical protein